VGEGRSRLKNFIVEKVVGCGRRKYLRNKESKVKVERK